MWRMQGAPEGGSQDSAFLRRACWRLGLEQRLHALASSSGPRPRRLFLWCWWNHHKVRPTTLLPRPAASSSQSPGPLTLQGLGG